MEFTDYLLLKLVTFWVVCFVVGVYLGFTGR